VRTEFSRAFNFTILSYSQNLRKFDARKKCVFYSSNYWNCTELIFVRSMNTSSGQFCLYTLVSLDIHKAFDRVHYCKLYQSLLIVECWSSCDYC